MIDGLVLAVLLFDPLILLSLLLEPLAWYRFLHNHQYAPYHRPRDHYRKYGIDRTALRPSRTVQGQALHGATIGNEVYIWHHVRDILYHGLDEREAYPDGVPKSDIIDTIRDLVQGVRVRNRIFEIN